MLQLLFENGSDFNPSDDLIKMLKNVMVKSLEFENFKKEVELSLTFTTDEDIKEINNRHRNINTATDVLSFPMYNKEELAKLDDSVLNFPVVLGDIVVSVERAFSQADEYGHSFEREIAFLICHSMFHLLGYDHMTKQDEEIMIEKQNEVLKIMGITR